jgi:spermidine synthase
MTGTLISAVALIELFGFHRTLGIAAAANWMIAFASLLIAWRQPRIHLGPLEPSKAVSAPQIILRNHAKRSNQLGWILFSTGFSAMAMEVVWARAFTPVLRTQVYSFAAIVFCYLAATSVGSWLYRRDFAQGPSPLNG